MTALLLGLATVTLSFQGQSLPKTERDARDYFTQLRLDRSRIHSGYVEYTVTIDQDAAHQDVMGSERTYRRWFDNNRFRSDLEEIRPNDPANAIHARYSYSDGIYRIIDMDKPEVCAREYTREYLKGNGPGAVIVDAIDTRLLGVVGIDYGLLQHKRLADVDVNDPTAVVRVDLPAKGGDSEARLILKYTDGREKSYTVRKSSILPIRLTTKFADASRTVSRLPGRSWRSTATWRYGRTHSARSSSFLVPSRSAESRMER